MERLIASEMPTSSIEEWRYSKIDDLDLNNYQPIQPKLNFSKGRSDLIDFLLAHNQTSVVIETRNGALLSDVDTPPGVVLSEGDFEENDFDFSSTDVFADLNALTSVPLALSFNSDFDGIYPVIVIHHIDGDGTASFPSLKIHLDKGVRAKIVEVVVSRDDVELLVSPVSKIFMEEESDCEYLFLQDLGNCAQMIAHQASRLLRNSKFSSLSIVSGGSYSRIFTASTIAEQGAISKLNAAYFGTKDQVLDFRTLQEHQAGKGRSDLYFKGAAANDAHLVYSGLIKVDKGATSTDAFQTNRNLVLSEGARADSVPNLDIQENDVRCSHASSVGPIDREQKYYLESRGIKPELVEQLIIGGFFEEMAERSEISGVREVLATLAKDKWKEIAR